MMKSYSPANWNGNHDGVSPRTPQPASGSATSTTQIALLVAENDADAHNASDIPMTLEGSRRTRWKEAPVGPRDIQISNTSNDASPVVDTSDASQTVAGSIVGISSSKLNRHVAGPAAHPFPLSSTTNFVRDVSSNASNASHPQKRIVDSLDRVAAPQTPTSISTHASPNSANPLNSTMKAFAMSSSVTTPLPMLYVAQPQGMNQRLFVPIPTSPLHAARPRDAIKNISSHPGMPVSPSKHAITMSHSINYTSETEVMSVYTIDAEGEDDDGDIIIVEQAEIGTTSAGSEHNVDLGSLFTPPPSSVGDRYIPVEDLFTPPPPNKSKYPNTSSKKRPQMVYVEPPPLKRPRSDYRRMSTLLKPEKKRPLPKPTHSYAELASALQAAYNNNESLGTLPLNSAKPKPTKTTKVKPGRQSHGSSSSVSADRLSKKRTKDAAEGSLPAKRRKAAIIDLTMSDNDEGELQAGATGSKRSAPRSAPGMREVETDTWRIPIGIVKDIPPDVIWSNLRPLRAHFRSVIRVSAHYPFGTINRPKKTAQGITPWDRRYTTHPSDPRDPYSTGGPLEHDRDSPISDDEDDISLTELKASNLAKDSSNAPCNGRLGSSSTTVPAPGPKLYLTAQVRTPRQKQAAKKFPFARNLRALQPAPSSSVPPSTSVFKVSSGVQPPAVIQPDGPSTVPSNVPHVTVMAPYGTSSNIPCSPAALNLNALAQAPTLPAFQSYLQHHSFQPIQQYYSHQPYPYTQDAGTQPISIQPQPHSSTIPTPNERIHVPQPPSATAHTPDAHPDSHGDGADMIDASEILVSPLKPSPKALGKRRAVSPMLSDPSPGRPGSNILSRLPISSPSAPNLAQSAARGNLDIYLHDLGDYMHDYDPSEPDTGFTGSAVASSSKSSGDRYPGPEVLGAPDRSVTLVPLHGFGEDRFRVQPDYGYDIVDSTFLGGLEEFDAHGDIDPIQRAEVVSGDTKQSQGLFGTPIASSPKPPSIREHSLSQLSHSPPGGPSTSISIRSLSLTPPNSPAGSSRGQAKQKASPTSKKAAEQTNLPETCSSSSSASDDDELSGDDDANRQKGGPSAVKDSPSLRTGVVQVGNLFVSQSVARSVDDQNPYPHNSSLNDKYCHQCRGRRKYVLLICKCGKPFCARCLMTRYPNRTFDLTSMRDLCPCCNLFCNCTVCATKRGEKYVSSKFSNMEIAPKKMQTAPRRKINLPSRFRDADFVPSHSPLSSSRRTTSTPIAAPSPAPASYIRPPPNAQKYWGTIYSLESGAKICTAFAPIVSESDTTPPVVFTDLVPARPPTPPPASVSPSQSPRPRIFVGKVQRIWGFGKNRTILNLTPSLPTTSLNSRRPVLHGGVARPRRLHSIIGSASMLRLFQNKLRPMNEDSVDVHAYDLLGSLSPLTSLADSDSETDSETEATSEAGTGCEAKAQPEAGAPFSSIVVTAVAAEEVRFVPGSLEEHDVARAIAASLGSLGVPFEFALKF